MRIGGGEAFEDRRGGGGGERDQLARGVPTCREIVARRLGREQRRGVGAAHRGEQRQRHGAKAGVAARGGDMDQAAAGDVVGADRQARRRLDRKLEQQHVAAAPDQREGGARGVEAQRLAGDERARRGAEAARGGGGGEAARFLGRRHRDMVHVERGAAGGEDADARVAGDEQRGRGRRRGDIEGAELEAEAERARGGEDQPAGAFAAADEAERRAREGLGGEQRQRRTEPGAEPAGVGEPWREAGERDGGRGVGGGVHRGEQPAWGGVGGVPVGGERRGGFAHPLAARGVGAGEMVVAHGLSGSGGGGRRRCGVRPPPQS